MCSTCPNLIITQLQQRQVLKMAQILNMRDLVRTEKELLQLVQLVQPLDLTQTVERHIQNSTTQDSNLIHMTHYSCEDPLCLININSSELVICDPTQ